MAVGADLIDAAAGFEDLVDVVVLGGGAADHGFLVQAGRQLHPVAVVAGAIGEPALRESPWDAVIGCGLILVIAGVRVLRRTRLHLGALGVALLDLVVQSLLVILGLALLLSPSTLVDGLGFADGQNWSDLAFAPVASNGELLERSATVDVYACQEEGER